MHSCALTQDPPGELLLLETAGVGTAVATLGITPEVPGDTITVVSGLPPNVFEVGPNNTLRTVFGAFDFEGPVKEFLVGVQLSCDASNPVYINIKVGDRCCARQGHIGCRLLAP